MGALGGFEWLVIILVVLLLFGAKRIPELARGLGQGINEFRKASDEIKKEINEGTKEKNSYSSGESSKSRVESESHSEPESSSQDAQPREPQQTDDDEKTSESVNKENKS